MARVASSRPESPEDGFPSVSRSRNRQVPHDQDPSCVPRRAWCTPSPAVVDMPEVDRISTDLTVDGHHWRPSWDVGTPSAFRPRAISARLQPARALAADPLDELRRHAWPSAGLRPRLAPSPWWLDALGEIPLEFRDRDQASAPLRRNRCDHRDNASIERCQADAERLGSLLARVREPLDAVGKVDAGDATRGRGRRRMTVLGGGLSPLASRRHRLRRTAIVRLICTEVHLCLALLSRLVVAVREGSSRAVQSSM